MIAAQRLGQQIGPFLLEEVVGTSHELLYRGIHLKQRRSAIVRIIPLAAVADEKSVTEMARELHFLKSLQHPNIVRCYGGGIHGDEFYLANEMIRGGSLAQRMESAGRLPWEEAVNYVIDACAGLEVAHQRGVVHAFLTPQMLLLTEEGQIRIAGLRKDRPESRLGVKPTHDQAAYLAPEQIAGESVSQRTDLYALGCILYEMLTGAPPYQGETPAQVQTQQRGSAPARVSKLATDCPVWLERLVMQLISINPADRPQFASAVKSALEEACEMVSQGTGVVQHAVASGPTALRDNKDDEARRLAAPAGKRSKPRPAAKRPVYERLWFLCTALCVLLAIGAWALWPLGEDELFRRAEELMASGDHTQWYEAESRYLIPLLEKYPEGKYVKRAQTHLDTIDMDRAERRLQLNTALGRAPQSAGERLYLDARGYEEFGDLATARRKYELVMMVPQDDKNRPFVLLARRQLEGINQQKDSLPTSLEFVQQKLDQAQAAASRGDVLEAQTLARTIVLLYTDEPELADLVDGARAVQAGNSPKPVLASERSKPESAAASP